MNSIKPVLIIDDDEDDCLLIEDRLRDIFGDDCSFVVCYEKSEAIQYLKERTFYLCILDYRLAGYEGIEVLEAVSKAELATPIIMLTGQDDSVVAENAIKQGAQDFVMKSAIDDDVFEKSVQYAVTRKALEFARTLGKKTEAENVAKDKFIAHLSHELRTPLTSILGYTSLLLDNAKASDFHQELGIISNNGKHLLNLLNDVLDLSKIAANKFELKEERVNLEQTLIELNSLVSMNAIEKGLNLRFVCETTLPKDLIIDDVRFRQVLLNLLSNAIKFTDTGEVIATFAYREGPEAALKIAVKDTGIGMSPEQVKTIFSPFTQLEDVANRKAGGAGLGLSISSEIVKHMGGHFQVVSALDKGSEFTLTLPCKGLERDQKLVQFNLEQDASIVKKQPAPALHGKVLVVDDVLEIRQLAGYFIKETGVEVEYASNGQEAIEKVSQAASQGSPFQIVFMDLHMPIMTGSEASDKLKADYQELNIVAMTAAINKGMEHELLAAGFDKLIAKPLNKKLLWRLLSELLMRAEKPQSSESTLTVVHIVEDDADNAMIMQMMLEQLSCNVLISNNAQSAIDTARSNSNIQHHILDLGLPDLAGEAFLAAFFAQPVSGAVSILSGNQPDPSLSQSFPITKQLVKPINKDELASLLS
ncbi:response regulator [Brumicola blandensis]|uniref:histidine kinase n=1 Tax=Brumicola blandensis TaxID=3075611 RepID=A0AAW8QY39_9ALTE|nr:response regulator [Alteromonas sp. W409]MDT0582011.1 response regulator [Alteromonas sp. W409]